MGPAPLLDPPDWDTHSVESRYTEESKVGFETQVTIVSILKNSKSALDVKNILIQTMWMKFANNL